MKQLRVVVRKDVDMAKSVNNSSLCMGFDSSEMPDLEGVLAVFVNLTQAGAITEEGASAGKVPL